MRDLFDMAHVKATFFYASQIKYAEVIKCFGVDLLDYLNLAQYSIEVYGVSNNPYLAYIKNTIDEIIEWHCSEIFINSRIYELSLQIDSDTMFYVDDEICRIGNLESDYYYNLFVAILDAIDTNNFRRIEKYEKNYASLREEQHRLITILQYSALKNHDLKKMTKLYSPEISKIITTAPEYNVENYDDLINVTCYYLEKSASLKMGKKLNIKRTLEKYQKKLCMVYDYFPPN